VLATVGDVGRDHAREMKASYSARGAGAEIEKTLPLEAGETVLTEGMARLYVNPLSQRACYLRLSQLRLCVLEHYATRADRLSEVPPTAIQDLSRLGSKVTVAWTRSSGEVRSISLVPWSGRVPAIKRLPESPESLLAKLDDWRSGR
jgi:hypothetical protein